MARRREKRAPQPPASPPPISSRRRTLALAIGVIAVVVGGVLWFGRTNPPPATPTTKPNVLLITLDTTRADRLGSYGYAAARTPNLDRLAAAGVRFDRALSPVPLTLPAHASLMSAREPYTHGVRNNGYFTVPADLPTLAVAFSAGGYDTAAFVSSFVLDRQFGLGRGFATYDDALDAAAGGLASLELERRGDRTVAAAVAWLRARASAKPFFLWVHLYDPHEPYAPPGPFHQEFAGRPYDGEIAFDDSLVGTLLQEGGLRAEASAKAGLNTLVVAVGDHGESLGEHGESTHGLFVYESALRVPLIVAGPGVRAASVVREPVRLIDVAPTLLDLAGLDSAQGAEGRSLRPLIAGQTASEEAIYAETFFPQFFMGWAPLRSIRVGRWKYIDAPEPELYDLSTDPGERTNAIGREPAAAASLSRALMSITAAGAGRMTLTPLSDQARERLASLGYVSTAPVPRETASATLPDPKKMVATFEQLLDGNRALASGRPGAAMAIARAVTAKDPGNAFARLLEGRAALAQGQNREAMAAFKAYLTLVPRSADAHHWTALAALRLGDRTRALAEEEAALALDPRHTTALSLRAGLLFSAGRADAGIASLRDAIRRDPSNRTLVVELADLLADAKRFAEAEAEYRRVLQLRPDDGRALLGLGTVLAATNRLEPALEQLTRALQVDERDDEARFARAEVLTRVGREGEARADLERLQQSAERPDIRAAAGKVLARLPRRAP